MQNLSTCDYLESGPAEAMGLGVADWVGVPEWRLVVFGPFVLWGLALLAQYAGWDVWAASLFYDAGSQTWPWREHWLIKGVLHDGVQVGMKLWGAGMLLWVASLLIRPSQRSRGKRWGVAFLAMLAGPIAVGILKSNTHLACLWDETIFGGTVAHLRVFDVLPVGMPIGHGFPSAHASSGYAFCSLYFAAVLFAPQWRWKALGLGIGLGVSLGLAQQARGAHFLSHDLVAAGLCWALGGLVWLAFYPKQFVRKFGYTSRND